jgi:hypothetical protein
VRRACGTGDWTQGFVHARVLSLETTLVDFVLFCFLHFFDLGWPWTSNPPTSASWVAGITSVIPHFARDTLYEVTPRSQKNYLQGIKAVMVMKNVRRRGVMVVSH